MLFKKACLAPLGGIRRRFIVCLAGALLQAGACAQAPNSAAEPTEPLAPLARPSGTAQSLYAAAKEDLLQLRMLLKNGRSQSTTGSGFLIGNTDLVITNYHVVSQIALEPDVYVGEYVDTEGHKGNVQLLAVDVLHDLAIVRIDRHGNGFFKVPAGEPNLAQGQNLYSLGNPLDLGFAISEGTYNGISSRGFSDQLMFTGALNPGMSGGPNITAQGEVAGVNVSHRRDGELVSFLVPAHYVHDLLQKAQAETHPPQDFKPLIGEQLLVHQQTMIDHLLDKPLTQKTLGPYSIPVRESEQIRCWGSSETHPKETYTTDEIYCGMESVIFISEDLQTGNLSFNHQLIRSKEKNSLRFSRLISKFFTGQIWSYHKAEENTAQQCSEEFITNGVLPMRAVLCASAYRKFAGLYNFTLLTMSTDQDLLALKSEYNINGVSYENGLRVAKLFLQSMNKKNASLAAPDARQDSVPVTPAEQDAASPETATPHSATEAAQ